MVARAVSWGAHWRQVHCSVCVLAVYQPALCVGARGVWCTVHVDSSAHCDCMATVCRSCGNRTGFCACRGAVPGNGETDPALRGLDPDTVLHLWQGSFDLPVYGRSDWNDTVAQVLFASCILCVPFMCTTRCCMRL